MMSTLTPVIGAGRTALNWLLRKTQLERERRWQRDQLVQDKLLEIAALVEDTRQKLGATYGNALCAVVSGHRLKPSNNANPCAWARLQMLVSSYAPELRPHITRLLQIRDEISPFVAEALLPRPRTKLEQQELNLQFVRGIKRIDDECAAFTEAAAQLAHHRLGFGN